MWGNFEVTTNLMLLQSRMFATGAVFTHSQPLIEGCCDFQIPKDMRKEYGYPRVTDEMKAKIFGLNTLELLGKGPDQVRANVENDRCGRKKAQLNTTPAPWSSMERSLSDA